jgi:hypothetical protein
MAKQVKGVGLGAVLLAILIVQVLPQVDLPDTAFQLGTAPIVTKTRLIVDISPLTIPNLAFNMSLSLAGIPDHVQGLISRVLASARVILLCSLLC